MRESPIGLDRYPHQGRGVGGVSARRAEHRRVQGDYVEERCHSRRFRSAVAATWERAKERCGGKNAGILGELCDVSRGVNLV